ncbi:MAG TPA: glycosyltransferase family 39 protein [Tepidisphaeraceae bacterium]|jgi:hypothetical protein
MSTAPVLILPAEEKVTELDRLDRSIERFLVAILTIIAGALRLAFLNRPSIGLDEAALVARVQVPLDVILEALRESASPLHDLMYWGLLHPLPPHPYVLRGVPALAGTLLVPAVYALAKQMVNVRGAVLAAALTACSALNLLYARQALLDSPLVLMITLNVIMLLIYLRRRSILSFIAWILTGMVMVGLHFSAVLILPLELLMLVTYFPQRDFVRSWTLRILSYLAVAIIVLVGMGIIIAPIVIHKRMAPPKSYSTTRASTRPTSQPTPRWQQKVEQHLSGAALLRQASTVSLMGWEYPEGEARYAVPSRAFYYLSWGVQVLAVIVVLTLLPWPRETVKPLRQRRPWEVAEAPGVHYTYQTEVPYQARLAQPLWRIFLWLIAWILPPAIWLYAAGSPESSADPHHWLHWAQQLLRGNWMYSLTALGLVALYVFYWTYRNHPVTRATVKRDLLPLIQLLVIIAAILGAALLIVRATPEIDVPRWLHPRSPLVVWPPLAVLLGTMLFRIRWNRLRRLAIFTLIGVNLTIAWFATFKGVQPRLDLVARDLAISDLTNSSIGAYFNKAKNPPTPDYNEPINVLGPYYVSMESRHKILLKAAAPGTRTGDPFEAHRAPSERAVGLSAAGKPAVQQLILWDCIESPTPNKDGSLENSTTWQLAATEAFPVYDRWTWALQYTLRRRTYVKKFSPTAQSLPQRNNDQDPDVEKILEALEKARQQAEDRANQPPPKPSPNSPPQRKPIIPRRQ